MKDDTNELSKIKKAINNRFPNEKAYKHKKVEVYTYENNFTNNINCNRAQHNN